MLLNELSFLVRQPTARLGMLLMPLTGLIFSLNIIYDSLEAIKHFHLLQITIVMLTLPIVVGIASGVMLFRDSVHNMTEIIDVTPVHYRERWRSRLGAIILFSLSLLVLSSIVACAVFSFRFGFAIEYVGISFSAILLLAGPATFILSGLYFAIAQRTRHTITLYVVTAIVWIGYLMLASINGSPVLAGSNIKSDSLYSIMLWLDPYGFTRAVESLAETHYFLDSYLLVNRTLSLAAGTGLIYWLLSQPVKSDSESAISETSVDKVENRLSRIKRSFFTLFGLSQNEASSDSLLKGDSIIKLNSLTFSMMTKQVYALMSSKVTMFILVAWPLLVFSEVLAGINYSEPLSDLISATSLSALNRVLPDIFPALGSLLVVLWAWQITQYDNQNNIAELTAATQVKNHQLLLSHMLTLVTIVLIFTTLTGIGALVAELINTRSTSAAIHFNVYFQSLLLALVPVTLLGLMATYLFHLINSALLVVFIMGVALVFKFTPLATTLGITHTFWNIAGTPLRMPDELWGFTRSISVYLPYITLWLLTALTLFSLANAFSNRGNNYRSRQLTIKFKSFGKEGALILLSIAGTLFYAAYLHLALVDEKPLYNSHQREAWKVSYENNYRHWQDQPQPTVIALDSVVDLFPNEEYADFALTYTLKNKTEEPINQLLIGQYPLGFEANVLQSGIRLIEFNKALKQGIYQFEQPLLPGATRKIRVEFTYRQPTLWPAVMHQVIKSEFTYLRSMPLLPLVGYQPLLEISAPVLRAKYGLSKRQSIQPSALDTSERKKLGEYEWIAYSTTVSTTVSQTPISQGELVEQWQANGRNYASYRTVEPIRAIPAWLSVPFDKLSSQSNDALIQLFTPTANQAAQVNLDAVKHTMDWFAQHITPYRYKQLNLVAMPFLSGTGYALPQVMLINHRVGFLSEPSPDAGFDQRYRRAVHETAHQWFGHDIGNGIPQENAFLVESMAKYIELVLIEKHHGKQAMQALVEYEQRRFSNRMRVTNMTLPSIIDAEHNFQQYSGATLVFALLRYEIGDEAIVRALKALWQAHAFPKVPATSLDFVRLLKESVDVTKHDVIDKLLLSNDIDLLLDLVPNEI